MTRATAVRRVILATKLGLTLALGWYLLAKVDLVDAFERTRTLSAGDIAVVMAILAAQLLVASARLCVVLKMLGARVTLAAAAQVVLVGAFFGQTFLTVVGGDGMRVWRLHRAGVRLRTAAGAVMLDRLFGLISLLLLILAVLPALWSLTADPWLRLGVMATFGVGVGGVAAFLLLRFMPAAMRRVRLFGWLDEVAREAAFILRRGGVAGSVLGLGLVVQLTNLAALAALAGGINLPVTPLELVVLTPFPLLLSTLPISLGGWGVREGAMVVALGLVGVATEQSLTLSVLFGLAATAASLPGGLIWLRETRRAVPVPAEPTDAIGG